MTRRRAVLVAIALVAAIALVPAAPAATGAWFTAAAAPVIAGAVSTGVVVDLAEGTSSRTGDGTASVRWTTPADPRVYTVQRSVGGTLSSITATVADGAGATGFTDDLTVPAGAGCAMGWTATSSGRCAPGAGVPVNYRIASRVAGWAPANDLVVTSDFAPAPTVQPGTISADPDAPDEANASFTIANSSAVPIPVRVVTPLLAGGGGGLIGLSGTWLQTGGCDATTCWRSGQLPAGATATVLASWRDAPAGATLRFTVSSPQGPDREVTFVAP